MILNQEFWEFKKWENGGIYKVEVSDIDIWLFLQYYINTSVQPLCLKNGTHIDRARLLLKSRGFSAIDVMHSGAGRKANSTVRPLKINPIFCSLGTPRHDKGIPSKIGTNRDTI